MVTGCQLAFAIAMLERRASKRFVLAESGQSDVWDSSVDDPSTSNADEHIIINMSNGSTPNNQSSTNRLTVPKTTETLDVSQGLK